MNTDDLIARLAHDPAAQPLRPIRIGAGIVAMTVACVAVFLMVAGPRADLVTALTTPMVAVKTLLPLLLCAGALLAALRLMRPEAGDRVRFARIGVAVAVLGLALYALGFMTQPRPLWFGDLSPVSVGQCLGLILLLALPALAGSFALARKGASTAPLRSGAALGLAVSAGATAGYSLYCTQDNPIFFVTWYGLAILITTALGAVAGARLLRW
jgi:hypothetical protein